MGHIECQKFDEMEINQHFTKTLPLITAKINTA
jgi:hypothetical protein